MKLSRSLLILLVLLWSSTALAEPNNQPPHFLSLGLGAAYHTSPYRGVDNEVTPFPQVVYQGENFFLRNTQFGYQLFKQDRFKLALLGSYRLQGYQSDDSAFLRGMADRDGTLEAGLQASLATRLGQLRLSLLSDLLGKHNGHEVKLALAKRFQIQKLTISPSLAVIWQSGQLADYYYGVRAAEAMAERPAYVG